MGKDNRAVATACTLPKECLPPSSRCRAPPRIRTGNLPLLRGLPLPVELEGHFVRAPRLELGTYHSDRFTVGVLHPICIDTDTPAGVVTPNRVTAFP